MVRVLQQKCGLQPKLKGVQVWLEIRYKLSRGIRIENVGDIVVHYSLGYFCLSEGGG